VSPRYLLSFHFDRIVIPLSGTIIPLHGTIIPPCGIIIPACGITNGTNPDEIK
jgi:hypothetical protein